MREEIMFHKGPIDLWHGDEDECNPCNGYCGICQECEKAKDWEADLKLDLWREENDDFWDSEGNFF